MILHNNANYKRYCSHTSVDVLNSKPISQNKKEYFSDFLDLAIVYFEDNIPNLFKNKKDIDIAYALIELMRGRNDIENFNKKALYILIREMTNTETSYITKVVNVFKREYQGLINQYEKTGTITSKKNKFF